LASITKQAGVKNLLILRLKGVSKFSDKIENLFLYFIRVATFFCYFSLRQRKVRGEYFIGSKEKVKKVITKTLLLRKGFLLLSFYS
jgi:hypothetical protein